MQLCFRWYVLEGPPTSNRNAPLAIYRKHGSGFSLVRLAGGSYWSARVHLGVRMELRLLSETVGVRTDSSCNISKGSKIHAQGRISPTMMEPSFLLLSIIANLLCWSRTRISSELTTITPSAGGGEYEVSPRGCVLSRNVFTR